MPDSISFRRNRRACSNPPDVFGLSYAEPVGIASGRGLHLHVIKTVNQFLAPIEGVR